MPIKPLKPCNHPGCPALTNKRYCEQHRKQEQKRCDEQRGTANDRGYDSRHRKIRKIVMAEEPLCRECLKHGRIVPSQEMDHIDGNTWNTSRDNLQMLCRHHHSQKSVREQGGFKGKVK